MFILGSNDNLKAITFLPSRENCCYHFSYTFPHSLENLNSNHTYYISQFLYPLQIAHILSGMLFLSLPGPNVSLSTALILPIFLHQYFCSYFYVISIFKMEFSIYSLTHQKCLLMFMIYKEILPNFCRATFK